MSCWTDRWKQRLFAIQLSLLSGDLLASSLFIQERTCSKLTCWIYCSGLHGLPQEHDCSELESANRKVALCQKCNNMIMVPGTENWTLEEAVCISVHCINANAGSNPNMIYEAWTPSRVRLQQVRVCFNIHRKQAGQDLRCWKMSNNARAKDCIAYSLRWMPKELLSKVTALHCFVLYAGFWFIVLISLG